MDRDEIRKLAERHGFWAHEIWWKQNIPRFDGMISEVQAPLLKRIAELEASHRWIPVSERLPEDAGQYIVYVVPTTATYTDTRVYQCVYSWAGWHTKHDVTHWQPLPAPPNT
jgi:hypothetical protein